MKRFEGSGHTEKEANTNKLSISVHKAAAEGKYCQEDKINEKWNFPPILIGGNTEDSRPNRAREHGSCVRFGYLALLDIEI